MITNAKMLTAASEEIIGIEGTIEEVKRKETVGEFTSYEAALNIKHLLGFIEKAKHDIAEYTSLKSGSTEYIKPNQLEDIPRTITQLRLHYGWSQAKLAEEIGVAQQQIARYEVTNYEGISFQRMLALLEAFDTNVSIEKIKLTINGKPREKFLVPRGISDVMVSERKTKVRERGLLNIER